MAKNNPVIICIARQIRSSDPKFHYPLIVDGVGRFTRALFAILNNGRLFSYLCIICVSWWPP